MLVVLSSLDIIPACPTPLIWDHPNTGPHSQGSPGLIRRHGPRVSEIQVWGQIRPSRATICWPCFAKKSTPLPLRSAWYEMGGPWEKGSIWSSVFLLITKGKFVITAKRVAKSSPFYGWEKSILLDLSCFWSEYGVCRIKNGWFVVFSLFKSWWWSTACSFIPCDLTFVSVRTSCRSCESYSWYGKLSWYK